MKNYKFLLKPIFFIINLVIATVLVLAIEKLKPSDFGAHKTLFDPAPPPRIVTPEDKGFLKSLATDYKNGVIDSLTLDKKLQEYLEVPEDAKEELTQK